MFCPHCTVAMIETSSGDMGVTYECPKCGTTLDIPFTENHVADLRHKGAA